MNGWLGYTLAGGLGFALGVAMMLALVAYCKRGE